MDVPKIKGVVDIVVLMDVTGSMQPCIDAVKRSVSTFINSMVVADANNSAPIQDWRLKVVGYRDHERDGDAWFADNPFVKDVAAVEAQLAAPAMQARGGGDEPESLLDALYKVLTMQEAGVQDGDDPARWRPLGTARRAIIFFTDATFKEFMSLPEAKGGQVNDVLIKIASSSVILCGFHPEWSGYNELGSADKADLQSIVTLAESPALAGLGKHGIEGTEAQRVAAEAMKRKAGNPAAFTKLLEQLGKTLSKQAHVERLD